MHILIAGATGKTGRRIASEILERGHTPVALVRDGSDTSTLPEGTETRSGDLTDLDDDVCAGMDAVIFAAGSGSKTGPEMTQKVDRDGAIRLVDLAKEARVSRFVMLSGIGADQPDPDSKIVHYLEAKHAADTHLAVSGLPHVIVRPVSLTDDGPTGDVVLGPDVDRGAKATRGDVAALLAEAAISGRYDDQDFDMQSR